MRYLLFAVVFLFGCATQNPQQAVFQVETGYKAALSAATTYKRSPAATPANVKILQQADDVAAPALKAAEASVRNPAFDTNATNAVVVAAQEALRALLETLAKIGLVVAPTP